MTISTQSSPTPAKGALQHISFFCPATKLYILQHRPLFLFLFNCSRPIPSHTLLFHFFVSLSSRFSSSWIIVDLRKLSRCWITGSRELLVHSINLSINLFSQFVIVVNQCLWLFQDFTICGRYEIFTVDLFIVWFLLHVTNY